MSLLDEVAGLLTGRGIDLALLKLYAGGPQDAWDIDQLLNAEPVIATQVEAGLASLPADGADLWRTILDRRCP